MSFLKNIFSTKDKPIKSYKDFWEWFQKNEATFFKVVKEEHNIEEDFFDKLSPKLNEIKDGFYYVTGMFDENTVELIFTADGILKNIPFIEELVDAAPKITGWIFTALKPELDIENVSIEMGNYWFKRDNIYFYSNDDDDLPDEIDITIVYSDFNEDNKTTITNGIYLFLDNFLGELNFSSTIDKITVCGKQQNQQNLVPIEKLKEYLSWREKEFIEKYKGVISSTENDKYTLFKAELQSGNSLIAAINTDLLGWDCKASHPWVLEIEIKYNGNNNRGMPDKKTLDMLNEMEKEIIRQLKNENGYLNIGRETGNNMRQSYFVCRDFRLPSKVANNLTQKYSANFDSMYYNIYKDKYWQSFKRFVKY